MLKKIFIVRAARYFYFNIFKKVFFVDYIIENIIRRISIFYNRGIEVSIIANFENKALYDDYFFRINWYLKPISNSIKTINFSSSFFNEKREIPEYLNSTIKNHLIEEKKIVFNKNIKKKFYHNKFNFIVLNCSSSEHKKFDKNEILFNSHEYGMGTLNSLKLGELNFNNRKLIKQSHKKLLQIKNASKSNSILLIGSGPNSKELESKDLDDVDIMICNSVVKDQEFLDKFPPRYIIFADPGFHAGPSRYVEEFHKSLIQTIEKFDSFVITVKRDAHIIYEYIPKKYHKNFLFIPYVKTNKKTMLNFNLTKKYFVAGTNNILTLLMLPVAFHLYENIFFAGFDGNPDKNKNYYWKHNSSLQFVSEMNSMEKAHTYYFNKNKTDYDIYYDIHIKNLKNWFNLRNLGTHKLYNLTTSNIELFQKIYL